MKVDRVSVQFTLYQAPHPEELLIQAFKGMTYVTLPKTREADPPGNH